jgi:hypothetical protein
MAGFKDREKGFEAKYQRDEQLKFRVNARRNKLLGMWAAELLGMTGPAAETYAKDVVSSDFASAGDADVVTKVLADFAAKGVDMDERRLRKEMTRLLDEAKHQLERELT